MTTAAIGLLYGAATLLAMFAGMPIAFALGAVATVFMIVFMPAASVDTITQNVYEEMASITLLSIPLFILKGSAIGRSRAGQDLYGALHAWMHRIPGGLGIANVFACALFAAMAGSSPATCSAIGSAGIPEMRKRGYSGGFAAGIIAAGGTLGILLPPSITMILFAVAAEKSLGRLFLAGIGPGLLLVSLFGVYAVIHFRKEFAAASAIYSVWRPSDLAPIMKSTIRDSTMLMMIIGMSLLYTYVMSYLHISQSAAESIVAMHLPRWELLAAILRNVAPDIPLSEVIWGTLPFVLLMMAAVLMLCLLPGISTGLPDLIMGPDGGR